ncbi:hypothetical protein Btru_008245 [Bulinus truncatus]|nr:hypothetical protein Btru_008245 [Bulinus truncatus]
MTRSKCCVLVVLLFTYINGVSTMANPDVIGMAVAGCVSFVMVCVIVAFLFLAFGWTHWFDHWMKQRDKVRMPRSYFKKKDEIKRKLLADSTGSELNGGLPAQNVDRASWVRGWNQKQPSFANRPYEDKDATIELGDEDPEYVEFKIETEVVDNEHLDVGPFKTDHDHSKEIPIEGHVYNEPYLYSSVNTLTKKYSKNKSDKDRSESPKEVTEMIDLSGDLPLDSSVKVKEYDETLIHL